MYHNQSGKHIINYLVANKEKMDTEKTIKCIAIIGGTGKEGKGLAFRWLKAGYSVIIGSREKQKAEYAVKEVSLLESTELSENIVAAENSNAVKKADIVVLTIPYQFHSEMLNRIKPDMNGKYLVDVTVPLVPPKVSVVQLPPEGSAALQAQAILGENAKVISAFQNISFELLLGDNPIECDVLVTGVDAQAREVGLMLVKDAGLVGWDAGPLENSIIAEGLTSILIRLNKNYQVHSSGIKITGITR